MSLTRLSALLVALVIPNCSLSNSPELHECVLDDGEQFFLYGEFQEEASMWAFHHSAERIDVVIIHHVHEQVFRASAPNGNDEILKIRDLVGTVFANRSAATYSLNDVRDVMGIYTERVRSLEMSEPWRVCIEGLN